MNADVESPLRAHLVLWLLFAVGLLPLPVLAWGWPAHRLIGEVAETRLTASARAEVDRLLATEPGSSLPSISTWADEFRSPTRRCARPALAVDPAQADGWPRGRQPHRVGGVGGQCSASFAPASVPALASVSARLEAPISHRVAVARTLRLVAHSLSRRQALVVVLAAGCSSPVAAADAALLRELHAGAILLMRHTQTVAGVGDPPGWRLDNCSTQRNLDERGVAHARRIGRWFEAQQLTVTTLRNSPWCRARDTARLAFGRSEDWAPLSNIFEDRSGADAQAAAVRAFVRSMKPGALAVLVSHGVTIAHILGGGIHVGVGESVVVRSGGSADTPLVIGRLSVA